jgi:hypothetical protein
VELKMNDILIPDPEDYHEMVDWAKTLSSFIKAEFIDVSDVDYSVDYYGLFTFQNSNDAMLFKLRWN